MTSNGKQRKHDGNSDNVLVRDQLNSLENTLRTATNLQQLSKLLNDIAQEKAAIDEDLEKIESKSVMHHQSAVRSAELARVDLSSTLNQSRSLKSIMENANSLSYKITERVRVLDSAKSQLKTVKDYIDNVKALKSELSRASDAIERKDWLIASRSISVMLQLPEGLIDDPYVEFKVPTSQLEDLPSDILQRWINELEHIFINEFNCAASNRDVDKLTYFFQLFPLIGRAKVGLKCYSKFICGIISEQSRTIIRNVHNQQPKAELYSQLLFRLYQTISGILVQHSKVIKSYYGKNVVNSILKDIQIECDLQSNLIIETYCDSKQLDRLLSDVRNYDYPILIKEIYKNAAESESDQEDMDVEDSESVELIEISQVTDELSTMMNHWSMYSKFFVVLWNEFLGTDKDKVVYPTPLILSSFGIRIHNDIVNQFDTACTYIIRRTLEKACKLETISSFIPHLSNCLKFLTLVYKKVEHSSSHDLYALIPEEPPISSLADDIIVVLNTIMMEVLATGELSSVKNMISNIKRVLLNDFMNIIQQRLGSVNLKSNSSLLSKETLQKIHQQQNPLAEKLFSDSVASSPRSRSGTPVAGGSLNVSASDIANTGAMFMRSLNAAISYTMTGEDDVQSYLIGDDTDIKKVVVYLNTIEVLSDYLKKMVESCMGNFQGRSLLIVEDQELQSVRKSLDPHTNNYDTDFNIEVPTTESISLKIEGILQSIPTGFIERKDSIVNKNLKVMFDKVIKARIVRLLNKALMNNYYMTVEDGQYFVVELDKDNANEGEQVYTNKPANEENLVNTFIKNWNSIIIPFVTTLANPICSILIEKIVDLASELLEARIWQLEKKVNHIGAYKLEQDVNTIISEFSKFNYGLRAKFVKVQQIVMVVATIEEEEVIALDDPDSGIEWALTPSERQRAKSIRVP